ncbi:hypothetical protein [Streptomyces sp. TE33382]
MRDRPHRPVADALRDDRDSVVHERAYADSPDRTPAPRHPGTPASRRSIGARTPVPVSRTRRGPAVRDGSG